MSKIGKNSLIIIGIVVLLFIIIWFGYEMAKTEPVDANTVNENLADENTGLDNIINELFDNVTTNEQIENEIEENVLEESKEENEVENKEAASAGESVTSKEEKAIALVKKEWGGEDGVYFSNESIDSQGRYIVSVRNKRTTNSLAFFIVDVDKELVTKQ